MSDCLSQHAASLPMSYADDADDADLGKTLMMCALIQGFIIIDRVYTARVCSTQLS